jgi:hypothetical protein
MALLRRGPRLWTWSSRTTADWRCASPGERDSLETASRAETERERVERESEKDSDRAPLRVSLTVEWTVPLTCPVRKGHGQRGRAGGGDGIRDRSGESGVAAVWSRHGSRVAARVSGEAVHTPYAKRAVYQPPGTVRVGRSGVMYVLYVRVSLLFCALPPVAIDDQRRNR